jgi:DUF4097 and DUF4098 domain-containing protein YvlB
MLAHLLVAMMAVTATDQTVQVAKGTKLDVNNFAGDVNVKVWDKDSVRVEVTHSDRETVDIKQVDQMLTVRGRSTRGGPARSLDYTITIPGWMAVSVSGTYADVDMQGVGGDVTVETTRGDIAVRGGSGFVSLKSVQGEISLEKAKGRVEVRAINEGIHLADISGDLSAESTNGSIILDRIDSSNVDLYTVNGNISYDGPIKDKGLYRLTTHNGLIAIALPEKVNATLMVRTYNGGFRSTFPLKLDDQNPRKRFTLTLGNGSAHLELESFGGTIALRRPGEPRPETERKRPRDRGDNQGLVRGHGLGLGLGSGSIARSDDVHDAIEQAIAAAQEAIPHAMDEAMAAMPHAIDEAMAAMPQAIDDAMAAVHEALEAMPHPMPHPMPMPRR